MSDRTYDSEGEGVIPYPLWWNIVTRAINGPRGQAALAELEQALLALPRRRLIEEDISDGHDVCALGAMAYKRERDRCPNETPEEIIDGLYRSYGESGSLGIWECGISLRLTDAVAWLISHVNDDLAVVSRPSGRWWFVMSWCRAMQGKPPFKLSEVAHER